MAKVARAGSRQIHLALDDGEVALLNRLGTDLDTDNVSEVVRRAVKACDAAYLAATPVVGRDGIVRVRGTAHVRVPDSVADAVNVACHASGTHQSDVVVHALRRLMGFRTGLDASRDRGDFPIRLPIDPDILARAGIVAPPSRGVRPAVS